MRGWEDVEAAFRSALLHVGLDGLRQPSRCRAELGRRCGGRTAELGALLDLVSMGAEVLTSSDAGTISDAPTLAAALRDRGVAPDHATWVSELWAPLLVHLRRGSGADGGPSDATSAPTDQAATTATFLFTDIESSTQRWEADAAAMRACLALHDELLHECVTAHGGRVFKHTGDGVCAAFPSPTAAVQAALEAQLALAGAGWPGGVPLRVRMGIHTGEARMRADDYEGPALARTARLQDAGHGGQVLVSSATELLVRHRLRAPLGLTSLGAYHLRDAPEPEELFQLTHPSVAGPFDPPRTNPRRLHNLRPQLTTFLGRGQDLEALGDLLAHARLVTLVGAGGVGKTRLALEVAAAAADRYPDGVWLAELAPVDAASDVVEAIATSLGVHLRGSSTTLGSVCDWLAARRTLVLLDNCEHVIDPVRAFVERTLEACPSVSLLLTTREALGLPGERQWLTKPLTVPPAEVRDPGAARAFEAVELFVARAAAVDRDFELDAENVADVAAICKRLDGMPLALELAAARMQAMGPAELLGLLDERFRLLARPAAGPRHSLRGAVDWSYALLEDASRLLFRRLSVFAGSWSLAACEAVCATDGIDARDIVDLLSDLVAKSLVTAERAPQGTRYRLLETLRHYGQERLVEAQDGDEVRRRHARWACALAQGAAPGLHGPAERASGDLVQLEFDNLRAAMQWAVANLDGEIAFGIVAALEDYTILRLDYEVAAWAEQLLAVGAWTDHPRRHFALGLAAHAAWARADNETALELGLAAITSERRFGASPSWAARQAVGNATWFRGWPDRALGHFTSWAEEAQEASNPFQRSWARAHVAVVESFLGRRSHALAAAEEALELARRCGSPFLLALTLYAKSECVPDDDAARQLVEEGIAAGRDSGNRFAYGLCLSTLASLTGRKGDPAEALTLYRLAMENWRAAGNWSNQRVLLRNLAEFAARIGHPELTPRLLGGLEASGEMLGANGPEGERLALAVASARQALGRRYDHLVDEGRQTGAVALVRDTIDWLDQATEPGVVAGAVRRAPPAREEGLTNREQEIVALVASGLTNRGIAQRLFISERTVDTHITRIRRKLGTTTRTQLAIWGLEHLPAAAGT